jgi:tetratricopeptide (TPR) repeat protein
MNVMSAFFAAAALFMLALGVFELSGSAFACVSVFFLAFSPAYWRLAQVSEMYSFNAFLVGSIIYLAVKNYAGEKAPERANTVYFISLACGMACANHPTAIFVLPGLFWLVYRSGSLKAKDYFLALLFFAAGISVDLFLMVRANTHPLLDWGKPETPLKLFRAVTRGDYGGLKLHPEESKFSWTAATLWGHLALYAKSLSSEFGLPAAIFGALGLFLKRKEKIYKALFISLVISGPLFIIISNLPPSEKTTLPILEPHLVLANLIFAYFIAAGVKVIAGRGIALKAIVIALVAVLFILKLPLCGYRNHFFAYDYGKNIFKSAPQGSIIYDPDDTTAFITTYMQAVSHKRPDIMLAAYFRTRWGYELLKERHPGMLPERDIVSGQELSRQLLDFNRAKAAIFAELPVKFPAGYSSYPQGILYRLSVNNEFVPKPELFEFYSCRGGFRQQDNYDYFTNQVISYSASAHNNMGLALGSLGRYDEARAQYLEALSIDPGMEAAFNNMGTLEFSQKKYPDAEKWFLELLARNPESASAMFNLGVTYQAMKNSGLAAKYFEEAWQKYYYADAGNELGLMALHAGNPSGARDMFNSVLEAHREYLLAYYNMGLAQKALGNYEESRKYFSVFADNTPNPQDRKDALAIINSLLKISHAATVGNH